MENSVQAMAWGVVVGVLTGCLLCAIIVSRLNDKWRAVVAKQAQRHRQNVEYVYTHNAECAKACRGMKEPVKTVQGLKATALVAHKVFGIGAEEIQDLEVRV